MPAQEPGTRPARPLPYRPDADGEYEPDAGRFRLALRNGGTESVHFTLHPYAGEYEAPRHRDVAGRGDTEVGVPAGGDGYRFTVTGPNGFRREFAGSADGAAARLKVGTYLDSDRREIHLTVVNQGSRACAVRCEPRAYAEGRDAEPRRLRVEAGSTRTFAHSARGAHGWYDLELTVTEDDTFRRRLMGHIENGEESVTG